MKAPIRLGFIPLIDASIPIVVADKGFAAAEGLEIELVRETSWANIRDRLAIGHFDAAHMLAPMPVAAALGLTPLDVPVVAAMTLGVGGNATTVSEALWQAMLRVAPDVVANDAKSVGRALRLALRTWPGGKPTLAVVHPHSSHNYELRYWLAASGIQPGRDIELAILAPPLMPDALASGSLDGFSAGEPWSSHAARRFGGRIVLTKSAIWRDGPEKILGLRAPWAKANPDAVQALLRACRRAATWCADKSNADELIDILAAPGRLHLPKEDIAAPLTGKMLLADGRRHQLQDFLVFGGGEANAPRRETAIWFLTQMARWGQTTLSDEARRRAEASYAPELFAASGGRKEPYRMAPVSGLFDGEVFEPADAEAYLARQILRDQRQDPA
jgi:NitT/TauT family transport system ATP-binding protein